MLIAYHSAHTRDSVALNYTELANKSIIFHAFTSLGNNSLVVGGIAIGGISNVAEKILPLMLSPCYGHQCLNTSKLNTCEVILAKSLTLRWH